ncbi:hypothetical protein HDU98_001302, partial [Podochytrium sp. JEL0797]
GKMQRFGCDGRLNMVFSTGSSSVRLKFVHGAPHEPYRDISLPDAVREKVLGLAEMNMSLGDIFKTVEREIGDQEVYFSRSGIRRVYKSVTEGMWKLDENPWLSMGKLCETNDGQHCLEIIDMSHVEGMQCMGFFFRRLMERFGEKGDIGELFVDATYNTNKQGAELFLLKGLSKETGHFVPLGLLFAKSSLKSSAANATRVQNAKTKVVRQFLLDFQRKGVDPHTTHSDKDFAEINACQSVWPYAKHNLCYWHVLRAVRLRLCKNTSAPRHYNAEEAHAAFSFISDAFLPQQQRPSGITNPPPPDTPILAPRANPGSVPQNEQDSSSDYDSEVERLFEDNIDDHEEDRSSSSSSSMASSESSESSSDDERVEDDGEAGVPANEARYLFCPHWHRKMIVYLMSKAYCMHPFFLERGKTFRSGLEVHAHCVRVLYDHCVLNNLFEVWAYLWSEWLRWERWKLWGRSSRDNFLSEKRTNMTVEAAFRVLKRHDMRQVNRPRLDKLLHIMMETTIRRAEVAFLQTKHRTPRLNNTQIAAKKVWLDLSQRPLHGTYDTNVEEWTCDCGRQKFCPHAFCKHLVQDATLLLTTDYTTTPKQRGALTPVVFFHYLRQQNKMPLYNISGFLARNPHAQLVVPPVPPPPPSSHPSLAAQFDADMENVVYAPSGSDDGEEEQYADAWKAQSLATLDFIRDLTRESECDWSRASISSVDSWPFVTTRDRKHGVLDSVDFWSQGTSQEREFEYTSVSLVTVYFTSCAAAREREPITRNVPIPSIAPILPIMPIIPIASTSEPVTRPVASPQEGITGDPGALVFETGYPRSREPQRFDLMKLPKLYRDWKVLDMDAFLGSEDGSFLLDDNEDIETGRKRILSEEVDRLEAEADTRVEKEKEAVRMDTERLEHEASTRAEHKEAETERMRLARESEENVLVESLRLDRQFKLADGCAVLALLGATGGISKFAPARIISYDDDSKQFTVEIALSPILPTSVKTLSRLGLIHQYDNEFTECELDERCHAFFGDSDDDDENEGKVNQNEDVLPLVTQILPELQEVIDESRPSSLLTAFKDRSRGVRGSDALLLLLAGKTRDGKRLAVGAEVKLSARQLDRVEKFLGEKLIMGKKLERKKIAIIKDVMIPEALQRMNLLRHEAILKRAEIQEVEVEYKMEDMHLWARRLVTWKQSLTLARAVRVLRERKED